MTAMHTVMIIPEGVEADDGRAYPAGKLTWRDTIPMQFSDATSDRHDGAIHVGNVSNLRRATVGEETWIVGDLAYDSDTDAMEAMRLADEDKVTGVSADVAIKIIEEDEYGDVLDYEAMIVGVTQLPMPAFSGARISRAETFETVPTITASAAPRDAFEMLEPPDDDPRYVLQPHGELAIPLTFEGRRFYGHAGVTGQCHTGFLNKCLPPPASQTDYGYYHTNLTPTTDGEVATGTVVWRGDHAPTNRRIDAEQARDHYAHHAYAWGDARASNGRHGVWVTGYVRDDVTDEDLETLKRSTWSGDWRRGELVGLLTVNQSAYPVVRASALMSGDEVIALTASGVVQREEEPDLQTVIDSIAALSEAISHLLPEPEPESEPAPESENVVEIHGNIARVLGQ